MLLLDVTLRARERNWRGVRNFPLPEPNARRLRNPLGPDYNGALAVFPI
jgi:hypothetical protein